MAWLRARWGRRLEIGLIGIVALVALGAALRSGSSLRYFDEEDYAGLATRLLDVGAYIIPEHDFESDFHPVVCATTALRPPGFPFLIAAIYLVHRDPLLVKLINAVSLILSVLLLARLVGRDRPSARPLAIALTLCCPVLYYSVGLLYPQVVTGLLLVGVLLLIHEDGTKVPGLLRAAGAGALLALLALTAPSFLMLLPLLFAWIAWRGGRARILAGAAFLAAFVAVLAPWSLRNYLEFGTFVPISTNSGMNLLVGNSPATTPSSGVTTDISGYMARSQGMDEIAVDRFFRDSAVAWIVENPGHALALYAGKVLYHFHFTNALATEGESSRFRDVILFVTYVPLLLASIVRLLLVRLMPLSRLEALLYLVYFGSAFTTAIFFTRLRFRAPFDLLLVGIVALFVMRRLESRPSTG